MKQTQNLYLAVGCFKKLRYCFEFQVWNMRQVQNMRLGALGTRQVRITRGIESAEAPQV